MRHGFKSFFLSAGLVLLLQGAQAQERVVTGTVTDDKGTPVAGATVKVREGRASVVTDDKGNFRITLPPNGKNLDVTYVGMQPHVVTLSGENAVRVQLARSAGQMDEVVVIGYGTARKKDVTGAVSTIKNEQLTQVATADVVQAMQGRLPGVQVIANSGEPGAGSKIRIRGIGSINGSNPIYVVDGYQTGDISFLAPQDIESIDVLKDASATAIYGSRGANGVVLITTKKGKRGPVRITYDAYAGVQKAWRTIPMTNATEFATLVMEAYENDGVALPTNGDLFTRLNFVKNGGYRGTNWQDEVMRSGIMQNHSLSLMGGNEQNKFRISGTYFQQDGIVKNTGMKKYFFNFSNDLTINKWLSGGISANFSNTEKNWYNGDLYSGVLTSALKADPVTPAWDQTTNNWGRADIAYASNPARVVDELKNNKGYGKQLMANLWAEAKLMKGLSFRSQFGTTISNNHNKSYSPKFFIATDEARDRSSLWERRGEGVNWLWSNYLNFNRTFHGHTIGAMAGVEAQNNNYNHFEATAFDVPAEQDLRYLSQAQSIDYRVASYQESTSMLSYFGRANYNYRSKYLLTATLRRDGSSKFLGDKKFGIFPSFAAAWLASEESFMDRVPAISNLKVRAGWGRVGNEQSASPYGYVTSMSGNNLYVFNDLIVQGFAPGTLSNPELQWEINQQANVGVDLGFFKNRLTFTVDYFDRQTRDMIVNPPIPIYVGAGAPKVNAGTMSNKGLEVLAGYNGSIGELNYNLGVNFSKVTNRLTSLGGGEPVNAGGVGKIGNTTRAEVGMPFPYFFGLRTDGIFNDQAELDAHRNKDGNAIQPEARLGDVKYIDVDGDGLISDNDRVNLGNPHPEFTYGFNADLSYKGFDLRIFFQGVQGNEIVNGMFYDVRGVSNASGGWQNLEKVRLNRWTINTPANNEPRMTSRDPNNNMRFSDRYVQDGSYLRLKNLQLGYSLPRTLTQRIGLQSFRLYVAADNLFTLTKYDGFDPEVSDYYYNPFAFGVDVGTYPQARTFRGGVTVNF